LVAGIQKAPMKVHKGMGTSKPKMTEKQVKRQRAKVDRRSRIKPFLKYINFNHLMPTRYQVGTPEIDTKALLGTFDMTNAEEKKAALKNIKSTLEEKFLARPEKAAKSGRDLVFLRKKLRF